MTTTQLLIGGQWTAARSGEIEEVRSPFDGTRRGRGAHRRPRRRRARPAGGRARCRGRGGAPRRTSGCGSCCGRRSSPTSARPQIAATISAENGKTITEATVEAGRSGDLIRLVGLRGHPALRRHAAAGREQGHRLRQDRLHRPPAGAGSSSRSPRSTTRSLLVLHKIAPGARGGQRGRPEARPQHPAHRAGAGRRASSTPGCPRACCRC